MTFPMGTTKPVSKNAHGLFWCEWSSDIRFTKFFIEILQLIVVRKKYTNKHDEQVFRLHINHNSQLQKYCGAMEQYTNWLRQLVSHESGTQLYIDKSWRWSAKCIAKSFNRTKPNLNPLAIKTKSRHYVGFLFEKTIQTSVKSLVKKQHTIKTV